MKQNNVTFSEKFLLRNRQCENCSKIDAEIWFQQHMELEALVQNETQKMCNYIRHNSTIQNIAKVFRIRRAYAMWIMHWEKNDSGKCPSWKMNMCDISTVTICLGKHL